MGGRKGSKYQLIQLSTHTQTLCVLLGGLEAISFLRMGKVKAPFAFSLCTAHYLSLPLGPEKAATAHFPSYLIVIPLNRFRGLLADGSLTKI